MALALALNRTLILPRLKCHCYKNWFANVACRLPGERQSVLPFTCTLEQWLRPSVLYKGMKLQLGEQSVRWGAGGLEGQGGGQAARRGIKAALAAAELRRGLPLELRAVVVRCCKSNTARATRPSNSSAAGDGPVTGCAIPLLQRGPPN
jgi:hypothetical protein